MIGHVEYSGGSSWGTSPEQIAIKLRHAPEWLKRQAAATTKSSGPPRRIARPPAPAADARRSVGWVAGVVCPGVSVPAYASSDRQRLPEQFTQAAWRSMLRQTQAAEKPIALTWGHGGPVIATTRDLGLVFNVKRNHMGELVGLEFAARLPETELGRRVLEQAKDGLGVSVGYFARRLWHVERDGVGKVRVVDEARMDHVAIVTPASGLSASYPAARCFSGVGQWLACPHGLYARSRSYAYAELTRQAGGRV